MNALRIGNKTAQLPIIQGGMGVGVSRFSLAGAVAAEGGIGVISSAQIGYDENGFEQDQAGCNLRAIRKHIEKAKEVADGKGLIGVNVMVALKHYREHVRESAKAGADVVICGAGLPVDLPELVEGYDTEIAPIVSSGRALNNSFVKKTKEGKLPISKCYQCLEKCNPSQIPYCITQALVDAVKGDIENGLIFCGGNVGKIDRLMSVHDLMEELQGSF